MEHIGQAFLIFGHLLSVLGALLALFFFSRVQAERHRPSATLAWLLGMVFVPYIAIPLYFLLGGRKIRRMARRKPALQLTEADLSSEDFPGGEILQRVPRIDGVPPPLPGNDVEVIGDPIATHDRLMSLIEGARESIQITTFILSNDEVARSIIAALARRAREGVSVRLLVDALGSFRLRRSTIRPLVEAGGLYGEFMPILSLQRRHTANLRNHRKIFLFDEETAMIGGRNIAASYMSPRPHAGLWSDFSLVLKGPCVETLSQVFAADWNFATGEPEEKVDRKFLGRESLVPGGVYTQIVASGPDVENDPLIEFILGLLFQARKRVWLVTPYFVPGEMLLRTLCVLAQMGRDVRVITPARSDRVLVNLARRFYFRELARAGAKIHLHEGNLLHAKMFLVDDDICAAGSPNIDMRSFYLNYEISAFVYSRQKAGEFQAYIERLIAESRVYSRREQRGRRDMVTETLENLSLILSPLL